MIDIDYTNAIDFGHCETIKDAQEKLSQLTNLLNKVIIVRQKTKKDILEKCANFGSENLHKLSWDNKLVKISSLLGSSQLSNLWQEADMAYKQIKNKQDQVFEDLLSCKKVIEITPH